MAGQTKVPPTCREHYLFDVVGRQRALPWSKARMRGKGDLFPDLCVETSDDE